MRHAHTDSLALATAAVQRRVDALVASILRHLDAGLSPEDEGQRERIAKLSSALATLNALETLARVQGAH